MLDMTITDLNHEQQTRSTQVRHGDRLAGLIDRATAALGVEKSTFLRHAIAREAQRVLAAGSRHVMTREDATLFSAALDKPPAPTPRALKAAAAWRQRVVNAD